MGFSKVILRDSTSLDLIQQMGDDLMIAKAAWVSTRDGLPELKPGETIEDKVAGVLGFLMKNRHGTPFEHGAITIRVEAPIFIWREWHRHRIGFSYNEESGRYKKLEPVFYVPSAERAEHCLKPDGFKPSKPGFRGFLPQDEVKLKMHNLGLRDAYQAAYEEYEHRLNDQYDNGLARICLPVSIFSACYVTCNPRSLMAFLELRTDSENATRRSHPLWELHQLAVKFEELFAKHWPITHRLWNENGRVAP